MKKYLVLSMACLTVSATALAAASLKELNAEIKSALSGFQNSRTQASLVIKEARTNSKQALGLAVKALYKKAGSRSEFTVQLDNLSYQYGSRPTTKGNGTIKIDLTKLMPQEELNQMIPGLQTMVEGLASTFAAKYGQAGNLIARVSDLQQDDQGNYTALKASVTFQLDYAKLPASVQKEDVMFDSGRFAFTLNVKQGVTFNFEMVSNSSYKGFRAEEKGLKEYIEALLNRDARTLEEIQKMFRQLDEGAAGIVEGKLL